MQFNFNWRSERPPFGIRYIHTQSVNASIMKIYAKIYLPNGFSKIRCASWTQLIYIDLFRIKIESFQGILWPLNAIKFELGFVVTFFECIKIILVCQISNFVNTAYRTKYEIDTHRWLDIQSNIHQYEIKIMALNAAITRIIHLKKPLVRNIPMLLDAME